LREPVSLAGERRERRDPNWTKHETARLCHVVADPRNSTALRKLYEREENRSELDSGRHDPWCNEFMDLFNDPMYEPEVPEVSCGAVQELLDKFDPAISRNSRNGARLKERWQKIRSSFTVAYSKWSKSGQNDPETFHSYTQGDESMVYVFCMFKDQPSLDYALRLLPEGARAESGIPGESTQHDRSILRERRRVLKAGSPASNVGDSVADCISSTAYALKQPIVISSGNPSSSPVREHEEAASMATALSGLMSVESTLFSQLSEIESTGFDNEASRLRIDSRLVVIRWEIDSILGTDE
jgi:hypothetical protein